MFQESSFFDINNKNSSGTSRTKIAIFTILLFHFAGLPFIFWEVSRPLFLAATPFTLLLSTVLLLWNHQDWNKFFYLFALAAMATGMIAEIAGVATGLVFGDYHYGTVLGWQIAGVPLVIGVNWLMCIYCCGTIAHDLIPINTKWLNILVKAIIGASLMVFLDFFIEPVAIKFQFWIWANDIVPMLNYVAWWVISFFLLLLFLLLPFQKGNKVAPVLYLTQLMFFLLLNLA